MRVIVVGAIALILIGALSKDKAAFRMLEIMLPSEQLKEERLHIKCTLIPGYAIWRLNKLKEKINEESKSENNPKRG